MLPICCSLRVYNVRMNKCFPRICLLIFVYLGRFAYCQGHGCLGCGTWRMYCHIDRSSEFGSSRGIERLRTLLNKFELKDQENILHLRMNYADECECTANMKLQNDPLLQFEEFTNCLYCHMT
jgi:hypothetical protein